MEQARKAFGLSDPRYGRALEDAAERELLDPAGDRARALDQAAEAAGIYFQNKHDRFADALALEAEILARSGLEAKELGARPFADVAEVPERVIEAIAKAALDRVRRVDAPVAMAMLRALYAFLLERVGESHPAAVRVLAGLANTAGELGLHEERCGLLDSLVASFECINALPQAIEALIQRAATEAKLGRDSEAKRTVEEALARADELGMPELGERARRVLG